ncbi:MAG: DpnI domain-containing protein [Lachnospiraceae bacterium]|nr:DpnI domain-containing protein [Lachnospiraceae bacterium]
MDERKAESYSSNAQKIRIITDDWVNNNMFCLYCGNRYILHFENNRPFVGIYCQSCK